jgi:hypothetical protein
MPKYLTATCLIVVFVFAQIDISAQCAMCKQAAESSLKNNPHSIARSLNTGILYLMAVPYLMIAFIFRKQIAQVWRKFRAKASKG